MVKSKSGLYLGFISKKPLAGFLVFMIIIFCLVNSVFSGTVKVYHVVKEFSNGSTTADLHPLNKYEDRVAFQNLSHNRYNLSNRSFLLRDMNRNKFQIENGHSLDSKTLLVILNDSGVRKVLNKSDLLNRLEKVKKIMSQNGSKNLSLLDVLNDSEIRRLMNDSRVMKRIENINRIRFNLSNKSSLLKNGSFMREFKFGKVKVSLDKDSNRLRMKVNGKELNLSVDNGNVYIERNQFIVRNRNREVKLNITPDKIAKEFENVSVDNLSLEFNNEVPVYRVKVKERGKIFGLFDTVVDTEYEINGLNGSVVKKSSEPWYVFGIRGLSEFFD